MNRTCYKIWNIFSCISIVISPMMGIVAICWLFPRTYGLGFDYLGVIVGILSLLVTILLGWNIYNLIDLKSIQEKYYSVNEILEKQEWRYAAYSDMLQGEGYFNVGRLFTAYREYVCAADKFYKVGDNDMCVEIIGRIELTIRELRFRLGLNGNGVVRDIDFYNDDYFLEHYSSLIKTEYSEKVLVLSNIIDNFYGECDYVLYNDKICFLYKRGTLVKNRGNCIYLIINVDSDKNIRSTNFFGTHKDYEDYVRADLNVNYDYTAIYEAKNYEDYNEAKDVISKSLFGKYVISNRYKI